MPDLSMPQFADPTDPGTVWQWDAESKSYIKVPNDGLGPDMNHSTGGDNDLFNQNQIEHSEQYGNPTQEGHMAAVMHGDPRINQVVCPMCQESTDQPACPTCNKDLTPEWNKKDNADTYFDPAPQQHHLDGMPEREPKPNAMKTDNSFPSMISNFEMTAKIANRTVTADEWDDMFGGESPSAIVEVGKWLQDLQGHMYFEHGVHALHENLAARNNVPYPEGVGALGSVYNDGTAETQKVTPGFQFDLESTQAQLDQAFGGHFALKPPIQRNEDPGMGREMVFPPFEIKAGYWAYPPTTPPIVTGTAWVKENPNGVEYNPRMILVAAHLQTNDSGLYNQGAAAIVTATGGAGSHAAIVANQLGLLSIAGVGADAYTKIETGNYLKIEPNTKTITVSPGPTSDWTPADKQQGWDNILQFQRQRGGHVTKPEYFAHIDEELAWRQANDATLDSCPECHSPMIRQASESVCHTCGHKQPTIVMEAGAAALLGLRALAPSLMGGAAGGAEAGAAGGMGGLMTKALQGGAFQTGMNAVPGGQTPSGQAPSGGMAIDPADTSSIGLVSKTADTFGEEEDGWATKDRGEDENPNHGGSSDAKGDGVEQLKDVNGDGGTGSPEGPDLDTDNQADPEMQDKAMKAFHLNLPLVMEFADSDEAGIDNPILRALDELLEEAFPGYKDGFDQEDGATQGDENPLLEEAEEVVGEDLDGDDEEGEDEEHVEKVEAPEDDKEKANQVKAASLWDFVSSEEEKTSGMNPMMPQPNGLQAQPGVGANPSCPLCGQSHIAGTPCPDAGIQQDQQNQMLQTMQSLVQPGTANGPVGPPSPTKVITRVGSWIAEADYKKDDEEDEDESDSEFNPYAESDDANEAVERGEYTHASAPVVDNEFAFYASGEERVQEGGVGHSQQPHHLHHPDKNGSEWVDDQGAEIQEGQEYEMKTGNHAVPDRVIIERVLPDKITYTVDSGDVTYRHELTKQQVETDGTTFTSAAPADQIIDSADGFEDQVDPPRPGDDGAPQVHDLSTPSTVHSTVSDSETEIVSLDNYTGSFSGDAAEDRSWLLSGSSDGGVDVDPGLMAKLAGKDYDAREQRAFIDESGEARNLDRLDLEGTHYITDDTDDHFNW